MRILPLLLISTLYLSSETYISNSVITNSTISGDNHKNISNTVITNSTIGNSHIGISINNHSNSKLSHKTTAIKNNFSQVTLNLPAKFIINSNSNENSIEIEIEKKYMNSINFYVEDKELHIEASDNIISSSPITVTVNSLSSLKNIISSGATKIKIKGVDEKHFNLDISGVNSIKFYDGNIDELSINAKGNYNVDLKKIHTNNAVIKAKGVGKMKLDVSNSLDVSLSGIVKVYYKGNPKVKKSISSLSRLKRR